MTFKQKMKYGLAAIPAYALTAGSAMAQSTGVDVAGIVTEITGAKASISTIGIAVLGVVVALAVFAWVRRAIR